MTRFSGCPKPGKTVRSLLAFWCLAFLFFLAGCRPHDFPQYPANYREYAYVTNGGSGTVSIYDVVNVRARPRSAGRHKSGRGRAAAPRATRSTSSTPARPAARAPSR